MIKLGKTNKIIEKEVKVCESNLFWLLLTFNRILLLKKVPSKVLLSG